MIRILQLPFLMWQNIKEGIIFLIKIKNKKIKESQLLLDTFTFYII